MPPSGERSNAVMVGLCTDFVPLFAALELGRARLLALKRAGLHVSGALVGGNDYAALGHEMVDELEPAMAFESVENAFPAPEQDREGYQHKPIDERGRKQ